MGQVEHGGGGGCIELAEGPPWLRIMVAGGCLIVLGVFQMEEAEPAAGLT
jgi:hypothetical protein